MLYRPCHKPNESPVLWGKFLIHITVADLRCKCTPLWRLVMYFCIRICTSPSNDYTAVACSNNNQAQLHTSSRISSLLISRRFSSSVRTSSYCKQLTSYDNNYACHKCVYVTESGGGNPKFFRCALRAPVAKPPFLNF